MTFKLLHFNTAPKRTFIVQTIEILQCDMSYDCQDTNIIIQMDSEILISLSMFISLSLIQLIFEENSIHFNFINMIIDVFNIN